MSRRWQDDDIELAIYLIKVEGKPNKTVALILNCTLGELNYLLYSRGLMNEVRKSLCEKRGDK